MPDYTPAEVISADDTTISYRRYGTDAAKPGLILVHGGMKAAQHLSALAAGRRSAALVTALKGTEIERTFAWLPRWLLLPLLTIGQRLDRPAPGEVSIAELVPTMYFDLHVVRELADTTPDYAALPQPVLLLGGAIGPRDLTLALTELAAVLPHHERATLPGLDHNGPETDEHPAVVARALRAFFGNP